MKTLKKFTSQHMRAAAKIHHVMFLLEKNADTFLTEKLGLSFMQALILNIIRHHPQTTQSFVVQCTRFTPGAVSRQIEVLREKGFLIRNVKKDNRREHEVSLTPQGTKQVEEAFTLMQKNLDTVFAVLSKEESEQLEDIITKLITKLDPGYYKFND